MNLIVFETLGCPNSLFALNLLLNRQNELSKLACFCVGVSGVLHLFGLFFAIISFKCAFFPRNTTNPFALSVRKSPWMCAGNHRKIRIAVIKVAIESTYIKVKFLHSVTCLAII